MTHDAFLEMALRAEAAETEVERMHGVFRMLSAADADALDRLADSIDRVHLDLGITAHSLQDALRGIARQSRESWAR